MNPFELLKQDDREVKSLFEKMVSGKVSKEDNKVELLDQIQDELQIHTTIEEEVFYPRLEEHKELASLIKQARKDHEEVDDLLAEVADLDPSDANWNSRIQELKQAVEKHVHMEETQLFPKAQTILDKEEINEIGQELQTAKEEAA